MTTKYGIFNPATGEYIYADTPEQAAETIAQVAIDFYLSHAHNVTHSIIEVTPEGETWRTPTGEEMLSPQARAALVPKTILNGVENPADSIDSQ